MDYFGQMGQAHLFERARRYDEAETDFKAITAGDNPTEFAVLAYGGFLERRGRKTEALALYDSALQRSPTNLSLKSARRRAAAGKGPPAMPSIKEGAAFALLAPAATMISAKQEPTGLAYLRLALRLDPDRNDAWLMLGDLLQSRGDHDGARAAYGKLKPNSAEFPAAQAKLAWSYQSAGDKETALKLARAAAATGDPEGRLTLSDLLRANEQYDEAIQILTSLITESKSPDWALYYARGQAYERSERWNDAEADLVQALKMRPEEAEILNYLGYAWIDRGERLQELEPADPEINNHLGDAYWMVGRKDEAGFQWRRVLTLKPDDEIKADAEAKLAKGLGPTPKLAGQ